MNLLPENTGWHPQNYEWVDETVFSDGDSFFARLCEEIINAKEHVDIESYIFDLDPFGIKVLGLLSQAAQRGVRVRLLIDGVGCSQWTYEMIKKFRSQGIEIRIFHPLAWQKSSRKFWRSIGVRSFIFGFRKLQRRNHRKLYIVDRKTAYVGSMNISARHLKSLVHDKAWRDTGVRITGSGVEALNQAFVITWNISDLPFNSRHKVKRFLAKLYPWVVLNYTFLQRRHYHQALIQKISNSNTRIWIANPYFVPDRKLMREIMKQASRIDVRLLFPKENDFFGVQYAMEECYARLLKSGAKVYTYLPSMMHAKILMIDDLVSIGSSNLDHLSLFQNFEADVVLTHENNKETIRNQFLKDLELSEAVELKTWRHRSITQKLLEKFFYWFRAFL
jgi:cardiolipin synthase